MTKPDPTSELQSYFQYRNSIVSTTAKNRVRGRIMSFVNHQEKPPSLSWTHTITQPFAGWHSKGLAGLGLSLGLFGLYFNPFPPAIAGTITSDKGAVEVIRGQESFLVQGDVTIHVGDRIRIGRNGQATLVTKDLVSQINERTEFEVKSADQLYVFRGALEGTSLDQAHIQTQRAFITGQKGSGVLVSVSDTGETKVEPLRAQVQIDDRFAGHRLAQEGDLVVLRSDTRLQPWRTIPHDLALSNEQIEKVFAKLAITRTKLLSGIGASSEGHWQEANQVLISAEQSFRSIVPLIESARDLSQTPQKNLSHLTPQDVYQSLNHKTDRADILAETQALQIAFTLLQQHKNSLAFAPVNSGYSDFDRYTHLQYLSKLGSTSQASIIQSLADNYVVSTLQKVQNHPTKIDQIIFVENLMAQLPNNEFSQNFITKLQGLMAPDIADRVDWRM